MNVDNCAAAKDMDRGREVGVRPVEGALNAPPGAVIVVPPLKVAALCAPTVPTPGAAATVIGEASSEATILCPAAIPSVVALGETKQPHDARISLHTATVSAARSRMLSDESRTLFTCNTAMTYGHASAATAPASFA